MYEYVKNKDILRYVLETSTNLLNELKIKVNNDKFIHVDFEIVGNKSMIMRDSNNPIDVDYSLIVDEFPSEGIEPKVLKDYLLETFNKILVKHDFLEAKDEVSLIQASLNPNKEMPSFNLNIGIFVIILGEPNRLIHRYKKKIDRHLYTWNKLTPFNELNKKLELIKEAELYEELRKIYRNKRNLYLRQNDLENHPAMVVFAESINELFVGLINTAMN